MPVLAHACANQLSYPVGLPRALCTQQKKLVAPIEGAGREECSKSQGWVFVDSSRLAARVAHGCGQRHEGLRLAVPNRGQ
jgi:hypothetical protein